MTGLQKNTAFVFIALSLCVAFHYNCYFFSTWGPVDKYSVVAFSAFSGSLAQYREVMNVKDAWRPRILANYLAGRIMCPGLDRNAFGERVALWNACWLFLCFLTIIVAFREDVPYYLFGIFACLYYSFTIMANRHIFPWDGPALLIYLLLLVATIRRAPSWVFLIAVIGTGFKETAALGSLLFLFWEELELKERIVWTAGCLCACVALKLGIDVLTGSPNLLLTMEWDAYGPLVVDGVKEKGFFYNLRALVYTHPNHPLFANGGTLLVFLLLPMRDRDDVMWKTIGVLFVLGNIVFAVINEYRIFHEMIPVSLWAIRKSISTGNPEPGDQTEKAIAPTVTA